jgi:multidrug efflux system membrane fusion protein
MKKNIAIGAIMSIALSIGGLSVYSLSSQAADKDKKAPEAAAPAVPEKMPVTFISVQSKMIERWQDFSGRLIAVDYAEIRPQISGVITKIGFTDGAMVNQNDVLFVIDAAPYQAKLDQAQALLGAAKEQANLAKLEFDRAAQLIKSKTISQTLYDTRRNAYHTAQANVKAADAAVKNAQIDVTRTTIKAPFAGKVSRAELTIGNLVEAGGNAPVLTSILSNGNIYADFEIDEAAYIQYSEHANDPTKIPVELTVNGSDDVHKGHMHSFDNKINPTTGTIRARALFTNPDNTLLPGMFAHIRMGSPKSQSVILVNSDAIGTNQDHKFVYAIDEKDTIQFKPVTIGEEIGHQRVILSGLKEGDRIVTEGIIRLQPNMPVAPQKSED